MRRQWPAHNPEIALGGLCPCEKHAATEGQRTIDLLHVALAFECGAKTFLSFDTRQRKLAKAAGLKVKP